MNKLNNKAELHFIEIPGCAPSIDQRLPLPTFKETPIIIRHPTKIELRQAIVVRQLLQKPSIDTGHGT
jgi:hypothetical protein